jgi:nucleoside-diphosphate-sugar epimerase
MIVITGATGFIGMSFVNRLQKRGVRCRALVRSNSRTANLIDKRVEKFFGDLRDKDSLNGLCTGASKVYHFAATQEFGLNRQSFLDVNVGGTERLFQEAIKNGVRRIVLMSSGGIHENIFGTPVKENSPIKGNNIYLESKIMAEVVAKDLFGDDLKCLTIVRPGAVYGPGDRRFLKLFRSLKRRRFVMIGPGTTQIHPVYINDLMDGLELASSNLGRGETFLLSGPKALTLKEWVSSIAQTAGVAPPRLKIPARPIIFMATLCELFCQLLNYSPPLNHRRLGFFLNHRSYNLSKAKSLLGYMPKVSIEEGAFRTLEWYTSQGWL